MKNKTEMLKYLSPLVNGELTNTPQPEIKDMQCNAVSLVDLEGKKYVQFEYITQALYDRLDITPKKENKFSKEYILLELTRRCNNSKVIRYFWKDAACAYFWTLFVKHCPDAYKKQLEQEA